MATVRMHLIDVSVVPPENFVCMSLQPEGQHRVVPIWAGGPEATVAMACIQDASDGKRRAIDGLIDLLDELGGVSSIEAVTYHEGAFIFDVTSAAGQSVELSATDALVLSHHYDVPVDMDEDLVAQVAIYAAPEDLDEYLGVAYVTPVAETPVNDVTDGAKDTSASGDPQADADFEAMMRDLGMDERDFGGDVDSK